MKKVIAFLIIVSTFNQSFAIATKVTRIIDGDTFEIETGERVRLIGINTPEMSDIFGVEAKNHLATLIEGKSVELLTDQISNNVDRYNRLLRYIVIDGQDINKKMILDGYAFAYLKFHFDREKEIEYKEAQLNATKNNKGIWSNNKKDEIVKQSNTPANKWWMELSLKHYLIISLIIMLIAVGFWSYFRK